VPEKYLEKNKTVGPRGDAMRQTDYDKLQKGVRTAIDKRGCTNADEADLEACLKLIKSSDPLPFAWDTTLYTESFRNFRNGALARRREDKEEKTRQSEAAFKRDVTDKHYTVGSWCLVNGGADEEEFYVAKIKAHHPLEGDRGMVTVYYADSPNGTSNGRLSAAKRRYVQREHKKIEQSKIPMVLHPFFVVVVSTRPPTAPPLNCKESLQEPSQPPVIAQHKRGPDTQTPRTIALMRGKHSRKKKSGVLVE
jgi:hypothetical protein